MVASRILNIVLLMTDLGRLELAREFLDHRFERTIWVDADIVVFNAAKFKVEVNDFAFLPRSMDTPCELVRRNSPGSAVKPQSK